MLHGVTVIILCTIAPVLQLFLGMTSLNALKLTRNALLGSLPPAFPETLQYLYLGSNSLTGKLPDSLYELNLTQLVLSNNQLKGTLSTKIGQLASLTYL